VTRKSYVASLESRTPEQIAEEEALYIGLKRLEQTERRFKKTETNCYTLFLGIESGLPDINGSDDASGNVSNIVSGGSSIDTKRRKKGNEIDALMSAISATPAAIQTGQPPKKQQTAKCAAQDALYCIVHTEVPANPSSNKSHTCILAFLQTPSSQERVRAELMAELQVSHPHLVMPTREDCVKLDALLERASQLVELKKQYDKLE